MPVFRQYTLEILPLSYSMEGVRIFALSAVGVIQQIAFLLVGTAYIIKPCNLVNPCSVLVAIFFSESEADKHPNPNEAKREGKIWKKWCPE